jgi:hypothetical protein
MTYFISVMVTFYCLVSQEPSRSQDEYRIHKILNDKFSIRMGSFDGVKIGFLFKITRHDTITGEAKVIAVKEKISVLQVMNSTKGIRVDDILVKDDGINELKTSHSDSFVVTDSTKIMKNHNSFQEEQGNSKEIATSSSNFSLQKVEYFVDSIRSSDGKCIRLFGGSSWLLSSRTLALITDDVIFIFTGAERKNPLVFIDGDEVIAKHIDGYYSTQAGYLSKVVDAMGDGALLQLLDGTFLSIPSYDQYDTGYWLPPYKVLITSDKMYLWNLKKIKRIWINPIKN